MELERLRTTLLATSSAAALSIAFAQSAEAAACARTNASPPINNVGSINCITFNNEQGGTANGNFTGATSFNGNVTNSGTITPTGINQNWPAGLAGTDAGISVVGPGVTLGGSITNTGTITGTNAQFAGINIGGGGGGSGSPGSTLQGSIINASGGTITGINQGIFVNGVGTVVTGSVTNATGATITTSPTAGGPGMSVVTSASVAGSVINNGTINTGGTGFLERSATIGGNVSNGGSITIHNGFTAMALVNGGSVGGSVINSGTINNQNAGSNIALWAQGQTITGGITNTGSITGGWGIYVSAQSNAVIGSVGTNVSNNGTIIANSHSGIVVAGATVSGSVINSNSITASAGVGIALTTTSASTTKGTISGGIVNSGTITANTGIKIASGSTLIGGITNSGTISGSIAAINLTGEGAATSISEQGGTLLGAIIFSSLGDTLTGYGVVTGALTDPSNNATLWPTLNAGAAATLMINRAVTLAATNKVVIEISPTAAAQLSVGGALSLGNAALQLAFDPGTYTNKTYVIVHSTGAVTGTFAAPTTSGTNPGLTQQVTYPDANNVDLVLGTGGSGSTTVTTPTGVLGDPGSIGLGGSLTSDNEVFDHLDDVGQANDSVKTALASAAPMQIAMNGSLEQVAQLGSALPNMMAQYGGWVRGIGAFQSARGQGTVPGYSANGGGFLAGIDHAFGPLTFGAAAGYSGTNLKQNDGSTGNIETPRAMLYGRYNVTPQITIDAIAGVALDRIHTSRPVTALGTNAVETHEGTEENLALQAGYRMPWQGLTLIPRVGAQYVHSTQQGFTETGASGFNLTAPHTHLDSFQPIVSISALEPFTLDSGATVIPELKLAFSHEILNTSQTLSLTTPTGSVLTGTSLTPAHNTLTIEPGVTAQMTRTLSVYANYQAVIGLGRSLDNVIFAGARVEL